MIRLENVHFQFPKREALFSDLELHVPRGQWVSIVGPNGSGKSTLVKLVNGLLDPDSGTIHIDGTLLDGESVGDIRRRTGYLFQNPDNQFIATTVRDDIAFGMENRCVPRKDMKQRIDAIAEQLGISEWLNRHPASLSGGQKQRVAIAGLLVLNPEIMIWDEATSMLDERSKQDMLLRLRHLHKNQGLTILSVTHDAEEILASDRAVVIRNGVIAADMKPIQLFENRELAWECRLQPPFSLALSLELREKGLDIGLHHNEEELMKALWPSLHVSK
ncbi:ATP-binding cassette domain-containing protein [Paenibacillus sp. ACRRX]|uniref:ATP-binding cassette domain-containing protein n=1 Tax=Paenibacillus sp. ACRRX TaxID=2918206 RepID=UPI001EF487F8|nr:ATP-binding cassette domain-containing protein [Paenibacillus sp. ACRRX]MCG7408129.1 ATP-binding cassette domain-containing protein [Paenibacillus sp. ACRRX]